MVVSLRLKVILSFLVALVLYGAYTTRNFSEIIGDTQPGTCLVGEVAFDTDNGVTLRCTEVNTWTEVALPPAYGQLYEDGGGTVITIDTGGTYVQWVSSTAGLSSLVTLSIADDNITVDTGGEGVYLVCFQASYKGDANEIYHWAVFVENTKQDVASSEIKVGANDISSQSGKGIVALSATDVIDLRVTSTTNDRTATVNHVQLTLTRIGL